MAVLQSATPAGAKQGTAPQTVKLKVGNVLGTPTVHIKAGGTTINGTGVMPPEPAGHGPDAVAGDLRPHEPEHGDLHADVQNPGAQPSNQISFTVLPGLPAITTFSPPCVVQGNTPATITITGHNFALPDSQGNAQSHVMYSLGRLHLPRHPGHGHGEQRHRRSPCMLDTPERGRRHDLLRAGLEPRRPGDGDDQRSGSATFRVAASSCP